MAKVVKLPEKTPVPANWIWVELGKLSSTKSGYPFDSKRFSGDKKGKRPIIRIRDVVRGYTETYTDEDCPEVFIINKGEILIGMDGDFNLAKWNDSEALLNQRVCCIQSTSELLLNDFVYFYLPIPLKLINEATPSITVKHLSTKTISQIPFPLPPLPEQHRIVTRIESLFAKLDEAKEKAQAVVDGFELRKSAILHKAFTGELTERWRKEHGVGLDSWAKVELIDILTEKPRNGYSPKPVNYITAYKSMTLSATTSGVFKDEYFKYIDETIPEDSYLWLKPGDILIQRANSLDKVGISAIYTGREHEFIYPDLMMKLQVVKTVSPQFVAYSLKKDDTLAYFRANATGTAGNMPKINQKIVSSTPINLPTFDEQIEIVRILESLFAKMQQAKEAAEAVLAQIDTMKKAILARAFRGELGTNDPNEESSAKLVFDIESRRDTWGKS